jgi:hypothetical protein
MATPGVTLNVIAATAALIERIRDFLMAGRLPGNASFDRQDHSFVQDLDKAG